MFQNRVYPIDRAKLPGILIFNKSEDVEYTTVSFARMQNRICSFDIEVYVRGAENYDNDLDQICLEIEEALSVDLTRGGHAKDTRITSFQADFNSDSEQPVAVARLTVEVTYQVRENNPDVSI